MADTSDRSKKGTDDGNRAATAASTPRRRWPGAVLAIAGLLVVGAAAFFLLRPDRSKAPEPKSERPPASGIEAAAKALSRGEFQAALDVALPLVQKDPNDLAAHRAAGAAYLGLKQYENGLAELLKVDAAKPGELMTLAMIGTAYDGMGNQQEAESWYLKALKVDKNHTYTVVRLADLYQRMNEPAKAAPYMINATDGVAAKPEHADDTKARSRELAVQAELNFRAQKFAEAKKDLESAVALTPHEPELHFNLAQVDEALGDVGGAALNYKKETEISPNHFGALLNLGQLQLQAGHGAEAASSFETLVKLRPDDARLAFLLAESYNLANAKLEEALRLTKHGLSKLPNNKRGLELQAELRKKLGHD